MNEFIDNMKENLPVVIAIVVIVPIVIGLSILFLRRRKIRTNEENRLRAEIASMERENQFTSTVAQLSFGEQPENVAGNIARLYKEHLWMPVYKIYAGRDTDAAYLNILTKQAGELSTKDLSQIAPLPEQLPAPLVSGYSRPQIVNSNTLVGNATGEGESLTVLPWQGVFGWRGLIVAKGGDAGSLDFLNNFRDATNALNEKLAVALEMANRREASVGNEQQALRVTNFLQAISKLLKEDLPLEAILPSTAGFLGADSAALWSLDSASQMLRMQSSTGLRTSEFLPLPIGQGLAGNIFETGQPLALQDAPSDPRCLFPSETRENGIGSYLGVPILIDARPVGVLEVHTVEPRWWSEPEAALLEAVAATIAEIVKRDTDQENRLKVQNAFMGLSESLQRLRSPEDLLAAVVEVLGHALGASRVFAVDLNSGNRPVTVQHEYRMADVKSAIGLQFSGDALQRLTNATTSGTPVMISDSKTHSLMATDAATGLGVQAELLIPVRYDGETRVLLYLHQCDRVREWKPDEVEFANRVSRQLALSLANLAALEMASRAAEAERPLTPMASEGRQSQADINTLPEALIGLDKEGRLNFFNAVAQNWFGLTPDDIGRMANRIDGLETQEEGLWGRLISSKAVTRFEGVLKNSSTSAQPLSQAIFAAEGPKATVKISAAPVRNETGEVTSFMVILSQGSANDASSRTGALKSQETEIERRLADLRATELQTRSRIEKLNALEVEARSGENVKRFETKLAKEREKFAQEENRFQQTIEQLLSTNQLKSEFIVNAGREISSSVQSLAAIAQLLERGSCGQLSDAQLQAVRDIFAWSQKIESSLNDLIEYGTARVR